MDHYPKTNHSQSARDCTSAALFKALYVMFSVISYQCQLSAHYNYSSSFYKSAVATSPPQQDVKVSVSRKRDSERHIWSL